MVAVKGRFKHLTILLKKWRCFIYHVSVENIRGTYQVEVLKLD